MPKTPKQINAARLKVAKLLFKAAEIASEHELQFNNGGYVDNWIANMQWELEEQARDGK